MGKRPAFSSIDSTLGKRYLNWKKPELRARLLESYRNTCKLHEVIDFSYVTPDKDVQHTRFADGTAVTVNFGSKPYVVSDGGKAYSLPQFGFFAKPT